MGGLYSVYHPQNGCAVIVCIARNALLYNAVTSEAHKIVTSHDSSHYFEIWK